MSEQYVFTNDEGKEEPLSERCRFYYIDNGKTFSELIYECSQCQQKVTVYGDVCPPVRKCDLYINRNGRDGVRKVS
jgi:hypothetical protein